MTALSYDVFLSHNRAQKDWTRELARRLREDGFEVWFDEFVLPKQAGKNWIDSLVEGVEQSRKVVLVWSPEFFANDWPEFEAIPGKVSGAWVFRGTRLPASIIFENLEDGMTVEEVMEQFDVTREQINAVLEFAARSLDAPNADCF